MQPLKGTERLEVHLKLTDESGDTALKVRATGPDSDIGELIDWFERTSGLHVELPETYWRRLNRGPRPITGQGSLLPEPTEQLSSQDATVPGDG